MNWRKGFSKSAILVLGGAMLVCFVLAQDSKTVLSKERPLFEVDLHKFAYDNSASTRRLQKFVDFTDAGHLAAAWLTFDDPTLNDKTRPLTARPAHLHAIVLDSTNGQKVGAQSWPTPSTPVRFLGAHDGKFLTCTGNVLRLFSPSFEILREQSLPNDRACMTPTANTKWGISPSRRTILLSFPSGQTYENRLLDVDTFAVVVSWTEKLRIKNISDHWLVAFCDKSRVICIRGFDKPWNPFELSGTGQRASFRLQPLLFANDDTLVMGWNKMEVATVDGTQLFQVDLPKKRSVEAAVSSRGGERFALIEDRERGVTSKPLDMDAFASNDRAVVYSIPDHRAIFAVKIKGNSPWPPWETHANQLALSPDGTLLAVITDATLRVYRLPDGQRAQH